MRFALVLPASFDGWDPSIST